MVYCIYTIYYDDYYNIFTVVCVWAEPYDRSKNLREQIRNGAFELREPGAREFRVLNKISI